MPHVDFESLLCIPNTNNDSKIACETMTIDAIHQTSDPHLYQQQQLDFPVESFYLPKEEELEWFSRNAFYDRNESTKGISNSNSNPNSQRFSFSVKSKPSIIGLPRTQESCFSMSNIRRTGKTSTARFFPKRMQSLTSEPSSPKVSCMGRVRSKRDKKRTRAKESKKESETKLGRKTGFWSSFVLRFGCHNREAVEVDDKKTKLTMKKTVVKKGKMVETIESTLEVPPSLGGLNRFVSGRRSDSWAGDIVDRNEAELGIFGS